MSFSSSPLHPLRADAPVFVPTVSFAATSSTTTSCVATSACSQTESRESQTRGEREKRRRRKPNSSGRRREGQKNDTEPCVSRHRPTNSNKQQSPKRTRNRQRNHPEQQHGLLVERNNNREKNSSRQDIDFPQLVSVVSALPTTTTNLSSSSRLQHDAYSSWLLRTKDRKSSDITIQQEHHFGLLVNDQQKQQQQNSTTPTNTVDGSFWLSPTALGNRTSTSSISCLELLGSTKQLTATIISTTRTTTTAALSEIEDSIHIPTNLDDSGGGESSAAILEHHRSQDPVSVIAASVVPAVSSLDDYPAIRRQRRRRFDRTKVRDRWWDLMRQFQNRQEQIRQQQQQQDDHDDEYDTDASSGSSGSSSMIYHKGAAVVCSQSMSVVTAIDDDSIILENSSDIACPFETLREAIQRDDEEALRRTLLLLKQQQGVADSADLSCKNNIMTPIQLAVHLNKPHLLRILLKHKGIDLQQLDESTNSFLPSLLMAVERGYDECLQLLLAEYGVACLVTTKDSLLGNNALHVCCQHGQLSILQFFLDCNHTNNTLLPKLFLSKNSLGQTPLHVACQYGQVHVVETVLANISFALLSKLLVMQDAQQQTPLLAAVASNSTDTVMSLFCWRGNNYHYAASSSSFSSCLQQQQQQQQDDMPCPMEWAVRSGNIDMVLLLLEFNGPSDTGYDLTQALHVAVSKQEPDAGASDNELVRVLIEAGADPCQQSRDDGHHHQHHHHHRHHHHHHQRRSRRFQSSAFVVAAQCHDAACLATLMDSHESYLERIRRERRRDPVLQKQPESFFAGMESRENAERTTAIRDALVTSLYYYAAFKSGAGDDCNHEASYYNCSQILYRRGAALGNVGLERLKASLASGRLLAASAMPTLWNYVCTYQAHYAHCLRGRKNKPSTQCYWRRLLMTLPWMMMQIGNDDDSCECRCCWIPSTAEGDTVTGEAVTTPDVVLVTEDGFRFLAHSVILAEKSDKLAAAFRFASMANKSSSLPSAESSVVEINVAVSKKLCYFMVQHIYNGSIACGLPSDANELSHDLLDLLVVAEEFICPTLIQECEMRLLSSEPRQCYCCSCARSEDGKCVYRVSGLSHCINPDTALDVLAAALSVSESCQEMGSYAIDVVWSDAPLTVWSPWTNATTVKPLEALREVAARTMLLNFHAVSLSDAFLSYQTNEERLDDNQSRELMLKLCLEEFVKSSATRMKKWQQRSPTNPVTDCK